MMIMLRYLFCFFLVLSYACRVFCAYSDTRVYRDDLKCGPGNLAPIGLDAICPGECCSADGLCGSSEEHCAHEDYREYTPAKPTSPPVNITAQYLHVGNLVLLKWDPPDINERNAVIVKYKISYYKNKEKDNPVRAETKLNFYAVKCPEASTKYVFKIAAVTKAGRGPKSAGVAAGTPEELSVDEQIYDSDGDCGYGSVAPNGQEAICPGECCDDDSVCDPECTTWRTLDYRDLDLLSLPSVQGLSEPTTTSDADKIIPSGPPVNVKAQYLSKLHVIIVSWETPESVGQNNSNVNYVVEYKESYWRDTIERDEVNLNYFVLKDVWLATMYSFKVSAITKAGRGPASSWVRLHSPTGATPAGVYRKDGWCGPGYTAENGEDAICLGECCVHHRCDKRCGIYAAQDYRDLDLVALDRSLQPPTTPSATYQTTSLVETVGTTLTEIIVDERCAMKPRRYDIEDPGMDDYFRGWADVQGQGATNDYCRIVELSDNGRLDLSCALAGTEGDSEYNFNSPNAGEEWIDIGYRDTWYMKDEDGDGKDDYCRCVGTRPDTYVSCMKAGTNGFIGLYDYTPAGAPQRCHLAQYAVNPYLGHAP